MVLWYYKGYGWEINEWCYGTIKVMDGREKKKEITVRKNLKSSCLQLEIQSL